VKLEQRQCLRHDDLVVAMIASQREALGIGRSLRWSPVTPPAHVDVLADEELRQASGRRHRLIAGEEIPAPSGPRP
jgi:hypothetical protein